MLPSCLEDALSSRWALGSSFTALRARLFLFYCPPVSGEACGRRPGGRPFVKRNGYVLRVYLTPPSLPFPCPYHSRVSCSRVLILHDLAISLKALPAYSRWRSDLAVDGARVTLPRNLRTTIAFSISRHNGVMVFASSRAGASPVSYLPFSPGPWPSPASFYELFPRGRSLRWSAPSCLTVTIGIVDTPGKVRTPPPHEDTSSVRHAGRTPCSILHVSWHHVPPMQDRIRIDMVNAINPLRGQSRQFEQRVQGAGGC
jgi:hypothetical protein